MSKKYKFEEYLEDVCFEANPTVLDDDMPDFFDEWISNLQEEDYLRLADEYANKSFEEGRDIGMKADNVLRKEGYDKALEDVRVLIARHANKWAYDRCTEDDIDVPALVEDINKLEL